MEDLRKYEGIASHQEYMGVVELDDVECTVNSVYEVYAEKGCLRFDIKTKFISNSNGDVIDSHACIFEVDSDVSSLMVELLIGYGAKDYFDVLDILASAEAVNLIARGSDSGKFNPIDYRKLVECFYNDEVPQIEEVN
jgi:hypothetical protein